VAPRWRVRAETGKQPSVDSILLRTKASDAIASNRLVFAPRVFVVSRFPGVNRYLPDQVRGMFRLKRYAAYLAAMAAASAAARCMLDDISAVTVLCSSTAAAVVVTYSATL
jgi:hypothetical protein